MSKMLYTYKNVSDIEFSFHVKMSVFIFTSNYRDCVRKYTKINNLFILPTITHNIIFEMKMKENNSKRNKGC